MKLVFTFETLLQTPVCMMTGEQLAFLVTNLPLLNKQGDNASSDTESPKPRRLVIDDAITQVGRKIVVDADLALKLAASAKANGTAITNS